MKLADFPQIQALSDEEKEELADEVADRLAAIFRKSLAKIRNGGETRRVVYAGFRKIALSPFPTKFFTVSRTVCGSSR